MGKLTKWTSVTSPLNAVLMFLSNSFKALAPTSC